MAALGGTLVMGCYRGTPDGGLGFGTEGSGTADGGSDDGTAETPPENGGVGMVGLRRLSRTEMDHTLRDLLGDDTDPGTRFLPEDVIDPFDNDFTNQAVSTVLVESIETMANDIATRLVQDPTRRQLVVGCEPTGPADASCMEDFVGRVGRRALRRPLTTEEIEGWTQLGLDFAAQRSDFYEGVDTVLRVLLQHPSFIYRVEVGTPTAEPGVFRLDGYEVATRLSYFVWGTTPSDDLLDEAEAGGLDSPAQVAELARTMLDDPRARERIDRFHAMWLGYYALPHEAALTTSMRRETRALLDDVIFDDPRSYLDVFAAGGSYVDDTLAELYGLPAPGSDEPTWVDYGAIGRQGLLSHGSFLSVAARFGDTSPTQRGLLIRTRLLCQAIPPPPPDVDVDNPPEGGDAECKIDRYEEHRSNGSCNGCHELVDPVGFGLEQYDQMGRFRTAEADNPQCEITGEGRIDGQPFSGPAGLADYVMDNELLDSCMVHQLYRMAMGHQVGFEDLRYVNDLLTRFRGEGHRFDAVVLALVEDEAFSYRREED
ncbi:MAG: DUF1588 domain-containing protein [Myxococcota bacterium]